MAEQADDTQMVPAGNHDGFVSSGDELEPDPPADEGEAVELVIIDHDSVVSGSMFTLISVQKYTSKVLSYTRNVIVSIIVFIPFISR